MSWLKRLFSKSTSPVEPNDYLDSASAKWEIDTDQAHEKEATYLRDKALDIQKSDPRKAMDLLLEVMRKYPHTWTVTNLVLDDVIGLGKEHGFWGEAIQAAQIAQKTREPFSTDFIVMEKVLRLSQQGKHIEALEYQLEYDRQKGRVLSWRWFAAEFAKLGQRDKAWELYNEAVRQSLEDGQSPHVIQSEMATFLLNKNNPTRAVELLIDAIISAHKLNPKGVPKNLTANLHRALKKAGINKSESAEVLTKIAISKGREAALQRFSDYKVDKK